MPNSLPAVGGTFRTRICALLLAVCGFSGVSSQSVKPSNGCGVHHNPGYHNEVRTHTLRSGGRDRGFTVHVPAKYNSKPTRAWPLIIGFHGSGGSGDQQHLVSLYHKYTQDYVLVYPNGLYRHRQGTSYAVPGIDDVLFTGDLLNHLRQHYCINNFAAFAMASAALYTDMSLNSCSYRRAILESHGVKDRITPYDPEHHSKGGPTPHIAQWISWWAKRNQCSSNDAITTSRPGYNVTTYSCKGFADAVKHYKIFALGHCWPSTKRDNRDYTKKRSDCSDYTLDFTPRVLDFFSKWSLSTAPSAFT